MEDRRLHVACACGADGEFIPHSAAMLHSVLANSGGLEVQVHYLHGPGFDSGAIAAIGAMVEHQGGSVSFVVVPDELVAGLRVMGGIPTGAPWYRVFLPELVPEVDRVLYLDLDVIVVDTLAPLWATALGDHYLGAVTNVFMREHAGHPARLGIDDPRDYFNNGVMLLNLEQWRREDCTARLREYALAHPEKIGGADQDTMNVVLGPRRLRLHPRWNCMNSVLQFPWAADVLGPNAVEEARRDPAIRHFEGPSVNKPWHYLCERDMRELYFEHRRQTPWPEVELEGRTPRNVARRLVQRLAR